MRVTMLRVLLWRALRQSVTTRFIGAAGIDEMITWMSDTAAPVAELRHELLSRKWSNTDKDLFNLAIAAQLNGQGDWLAEAVGIGSSLNFRVGGLEGFGLGECCRSRWRGQTATRTNHQGARARRRSLSLHVHDTGGPVPARCGGFGDCLCRLDALASSSGSAGLGLATS